MEEYILIINGEEYIINAKVVTVDQTGKLYYIFRNENHDIVGYAPINLTTIINKSNLKEWK